MTTLVAKSPPVPDLLASLSFQDRGSARTITRYGRRRDTPAERRSKWDRDRQKIVSKKNGRIGFEGDYASSGAIMKIGGRNSSRMSVTSPQKE
jgi:hypothetical protein